MIIAIKGENFTGKSGFGFGCPPGISWHETDIGGYERSIPKFELLNPNIRGDIEYNAYPTPQQFQLRDLGLDTSPRLYGIKELWYEFVRNFITAIDNSYVNTIVVDTFSQLYPICCDAYLQEKQEAQEVNGVLPRDKFYREQLIQIEYRTVNQRMHAIFDVVATTKKVLIITHHMSDVWGQVQKDGKITDGVIGRNAKGWHNCGMAASDLVDYVILMQQGDGKTKYGEGRRNPNKFYSTIEKAGIARSLMGTVIEDLTYDDLMTRAEMMKGT